MLDCSADASGDGFGLDQKDFRLGESSLLRRLLIKEDIGLVRFGCVNSESCCCRSFDGGERGYYDAIGVLDLSYERQSTESRELSSPAYRKLNEQEGHEGGPQSSNAPSGDSPDLFIGLICFWGHVLPVLLRGLEASPHEVVYDCRHAAPTEEWTRSVYGLTVMF